MTDAQIVELGLQAMTIAAKMCAPVLLTALLTDEIGHRAIGVVYRPERDRWANYVPTVLADRYDALLWFDETRAVRPLHPATVDTREPETFPSGV